MNHIEAKNLIKTVAEKKNMKELKSFNKFMLPFTLNLKFSVSHPLPSTTKVD